MTRRDRRVGERGQVLPILLFTLFALGVAFFVLHGVGGKTHDRIRVQQAADRAALAAATVGARALDTLAYVNEVIIFAEAVDAVYDAILTHYDPLFGALCLGGADAAPPRDCALDGEICAHMCARRDAILGEARVRRLSVQPLLQSMRLASALIVAYAPTLGAQYAARTAEVRGPDGQGVVDRIALFPGEGDPLQVERNDIELRARVEERALAYFEDRVALLDVALFFEWPTRIDFANAIVREANGAAGPYWDLPDGSGETFRERMTTLAFVVRDGADDARRRAVRALARPGDDPFADRAAGEVAMAAAEMYFTRGGGRPDGRPAWSARPSPLELSPRHSRPRLVEAIERDRERGPMSVMGPWAPAVSLEPEGDPRILH